jgi:hypothetical protein
LRAYILVNRVGVAMSWLTRFFAIAPPLLVLLLGACMSRCANATMLDQVKNQLDIMGEHEAIPREAGASFQNGSPFTAGHGEETGQCYINVIEENYDSWVELSQTAPRVPYDIKLRTILAHEIGHCQQGTDEIAADRFALAWTRKHRPQDFEQAVNFLAKMRSHFGCRNGYACPKDIERFAKELR